MSNIFGYAMAWQVCRILQLFAIFQSARSPGGSRCKRGLSVQFSVHFNHFQMTNS